MIPLACDEHLRERLMMGRREGGQGQFFYSFKLDEVVPAAHLVRQIDGVLDLGWVHKFGLAEKVGKSAHIKLVTDGS